MSKGFDQSRFSVRIPVSAPVEKIFEKWTTRQGLESFFLRNAVFHSAEGVERKPSENLQADDTYTWNWWGYGDDTFEKGKVLEQNGTDRFSFVFGKVGDCTLTIYDKDGETIVEMVQENIPEGEKGLQYHIGCKGGWTFYLANLKSVLEGGIDLRNRNEKIGEVISS
jgi:uncharacterized protein YndB with AHSA1/START domain